MSYELCKRIVLDEKNNTIKLIVASNNVRPISYTTCEFYGGEHYKDYTFKDKLMSLFYDLEGGMIQISTINDNTEKFEYAMIKVREYLQTNNINSYESLYQKRSNVAESKRLEYAKIPLSTKEDYWQRSRENGENYYVWRKTQDEEKIKKIEEKFYLESLREVYGEVYEIFKKALNERIDGEYQVKVFGSYYITKLGKYDRGYSRFYYGFYSPLKMSYKKAYILQHCMNDDYRKMIIEKVN